MRLRHLPVVIRRRMRENRIAVVETIEVQGLLLTSLLVNFVLIVIGGVMGLSLALVGMYRGISRWRTFMPTDFYTFLGL